MKKMGEKWGKKKQTWTINTGYRALSTTPEIHLSQPSINPANGPNALSTQSTNPPSCGMSVDNSAVMSASGIDQIIGTTINPINALTITHIKKKKKQV